MKYRLQAVPARARSRDLSLKVEMRPAADVNVGTGTCTTLRGDGSFTVFPQGGVLPNGPFTALVTVPNYLAEEIFAGWNWRLCSADKVEWEWQFVPSHQPTIAVTTGPQWFLARGSGAADYAGLQLLVITRLNGEIVNQSAFGVPVVECAPLFGTGLWLCTTVPGATTFPNSDFSYDFAADTSAGYDQCDYFVRPVLTITAGNPNAHIVAFGTGGTWNVFGSRAGGGDEDFAGVQITIQPQLCDRATGLSVQDWGSPVELTCGE